MPAAPLVGAVTTRPPEAFSSLTASAQRLTQSSAISGSCGAATWGAVSCRNNSGARRFTLYPPGSTPGVSQPRRTQACMTCQMRSSPESISASVRQARSLRRMMPAMDVFSRPHRASNSSPVRNGKGSGVRSGTMRFSEPPPDCGSSLTTKPPPTE